MICCVSPWSAQPWSGNGQDLRAYFNLDFDLSASLTLKLYVATCAGFATQPTDAVSNQPFNGTLKSLSFTQSILGSEIGSFATGAGTLTISNDDGQYDFLPESYSIDGRLIVLKVGRRDGPYDNFFPLARLTARDWNIDTSEIKVELEDFSYKLEVPLQSNVYGGTGGADGGADLAGKRKPLAFGECKNVPAVFVNPALLIYQAHDGPMQSIDAVYDKGAALTPGVDYANYALLAAASVAAGSYATCLAAGLFKLGQSAAGQVTADVKGDKRDGYVTTTADIVRWALRRRTVLADPADLDTASFDTINALQPAPVCYFHGPDDNLTVSNFIQKLMRGIGGWGGHRFDGLFEVRRLQAPSGSPATTFTRAEMLGGDIQRDPLPEAYRPPRWRWRVPYGLNWTVQTSDLALGVTDARKAFLAEAYRLAEATSQSIKTDHPFAQDRDPIEAFFVNQADATAEAARLIALFKTTRAIYRAIVPRRALRYNVGDEIRIQHDRFDLKLGRPAIIVERTINMSFASESIDSVEIAVYG
jgi:hypothetical protein